MIYEQPNNYDGHCMRCDVLVRRNEGYWASGDERGVFCVEHSETGVSPASAAAGAQGAHGHRVPEVSKMGSIHLADDSHRGRLSDREVAALQGPRELRPPEPSPPPAPKPPSAPPRSDGMPF